MSRLSKEDARPPSADGLRSTKKVCLRSDVLDGGLEGDIGIRMWSWKRSRWGHAVYCFLTEVRDILTKGMERTVVIKLLGRSITYFDLLNVTRAISRVKGSYRLVDMEGGFSLPHLIWRKTTQRCWPGSVDDLRSLSDGASMWIKVDGKTFGVEYEGLPLICFECGRFGHAKDKCRLGYGGDQLNNCVINAGGGNGSPAVKEVKSVQDPSPSSIGKATKQQSGLPKDPSKSWGKKVSQEGPSRSGLTEPMKVVTPHRNIQHASEWVPKIGKVNMDLTHGLVDSAGIGAKDTLVKSQDVIPLMVPSSR
ncbi:hypothetical protein K1719_008837 [Acacia pycnantha]|nr:hypothetical protein K1719_008837 [Acacia pycnantha]